MEISSGQNRPEKKRQEILRQLIEIEKECNFNTISAEELLLSKYMTAITDKKLRDKIMKENTLELKKTIELIKKNTYEKNQKEHNTGTFDINRRKAYNKRGTNPKNGTIRNKTEKQKFRNRACRFCTAPKRKPMHECPALDVNCKKCGKKGHYAKECRQKTNNNLTVKRLIENETNESGEPSSESEESIHHMKERKSTKQSSTSLQR